MYKQCNRCAAGGSVYSAGGLQLHVWNPYTPIVATNFPVSGVMQTAGETVSWTTTMSLAEGVLTSEVATTFPMEEIKTAVERAAAPGRTGKILLRFAAR